VTALHRHGGPLLRLLKAAAKAHGATDTMEGGLNSWCLAQLALHCLQTSGPAPERLPPLSLLFYAPTAPSMPRLSRLLSGICLPAMRDDLIAAAGEVMLQTAGRLTAEWAAAAQAMAAAAPADPLVAGRTPLNPSTSLLQATAGLMEHLAALLGGWACGWGLGRRVSTWLGGLTDGALRAAAFAARAATGAPHYFPRPLPHSAPACAPPRLRLSLRRLSNAYATCLTAAACCRPPTHAAGPEPWADSLMAVEEPFDERDNVARTVGWTHRNRGTAPFLAGLFADAAALLARLATPCGASFWVLCSLHRSSDDRLQQWRA